MQNVVLNRICIIFLLLFSMLTNKLYACSNDAYSEVFLNSQKRAFIDSLLKANDAVSIKSYWKNHIEGLENKDLQSVFMYMNSFCHNQKYYDVGLLLSDLLRKKAEAINEPCIYALAIETRGKFLYLLSRFEESIKSLKEVISTARECGDKNKLGELYNTLGMCFLQTQKFDEAEKHILNAIEIAHSVQYHILEADALHNLAGIYNYKSQLDSVNSVSLAEKALEYYEQSLEKFMLSNDTQRIQSVSANMGIIYFELGDIEKAISYLKKSLKLAQTTNDLEIQYFSLEWLSYIHNRFLKEYSLAYAYKDSLLKVSEKIYESNRTKAIEELQVSYETEKKDQENEVLKHQSALKDAEIAQDKIQKYALYGGLSLLMVFAMIILNRFRITNKQKKIIEIQKIEVEEKQREVIDSIRYAQRIQKALLKSEDHITRHLPEHFILFKPKDIVSGDFYWMIEKDNFMYLAVADCTGHGVPGAFLTMLGTSFLNEIINRNEHILPSEMLDRLRDRIISELSQTGLDGESKDGMDISLIRLDLEMLDLDWAGANNPLYYIHKNEFMEIKPDKEPIGYRENKTPFTNHSIKLKKGDCLFLFSDGYADQFGGPKGKKFKYKRLKSLLFENYQNPMEQIKTKLNHTFEDWKGDLEQLDDVCLIGLRL